MNKIRRFFSGVLVLIFSNLVFAFNAYAAFNIGNVNVMLRGSLHETYDDNVNLTKTNKESDLGTILSAGFRAIYEGKKDSFEFSADARRTNYASHHENNNTSESSYLNYKNQFTRFDAISLTNIFSHTFEPYSFDDELGRTIGRYSSYNNRTRLDYAREISKHLASTFYYAHTLTQNSDGDVVSSYTNGGGTGIDYVYDSATTFHLANYDYKKRNYKNGTDTTTQSVSTGVTRDITSQSYLDVRVGANFLEATNNDEYINPVYSFALTDNLNETTQIRLKFVKEYSSTSYSTDAFDFWRTSFSFVKQIFPRMEFNLTGYYGQGRYVISDIKDNLTGASAGLSYEFTRNVKGTLYYVYSNKTSDVVSREYSRNFISIGLRTEF